MLIFFKTKIPAFLKKFLMVHYTIEQLLFDIIYYQTLLYRIYVAYNTFFQVEIIQRKQISLDIIYYQNVLHC